MTSHHDAGLCERLRVNTCRYADETEEAAAKRRIATDLAAADLLESQAKALSEARAKLFPYADATEISGMSWSGFYLIGDKKSIRELKRLEHRSAQLEAFSKEYDLRTEALEARALAAEARLAEFKADAMKVIEPFAKAGELFGPRDPDGHDQCIYGPAAGDEYSLKGDHLRAARAFTTRAQQESKDD